jgi:hypothetical protein
VIEGDEKGNMEEVSAIEAVKKQLLVDLHQSRTKGLTFV